MSARACVCVWGGETSTCPCSWVVPSNAFRKDRPEVVLQPLQRRRRLPHVLSAAPALEDKSVALEVVDLRRGQKWVGIILLWREEQLWRWGRGGATRTNGDRRVWVVLGYTYRADVLRNTAQTIHFGAPVSVEPRWLGDAAALASEGSPPMMSALRWTKFAPADGWGRRARYNE